MAVTPNINTLAATYGPAVCAAIPATTAMPAAEAHHTARSPTAVPRATGRNVTSSSRNVTAAGVLPSATRTAISCCRRDASKRVMAYTPTPDNNSAMPASVPNSTSKQARSPEDRLYSRFNRFDSDATWRKVCVEARVDVSRLRLNTGGHPQDHGQLTPGALPGTSGRNWYIQGRFSKNSRSKPNVLNHPNDGAPPVRRGNSPSDCGGGRRVRPHEPRGCLIRSLQSERPA